MKRKFILIIAAIGIMLTSCSRDDFDGTTDSIVVESTSGHEYRIDSEKKIFLKDCRIYHLENCNKCKNK